VLNITHDYIDCDL